MGASSEPVIDRTRRVAALREHIAEQGLCALLLTNLPNIFYLTGFSGTTAFLVVTPEENFFFTDSRYLERVKYEVEGATIVDNTNVPMERSLNELANKVKLSPLGFEADHVTFSLHQRLSEKLEGIELRPTRMLVENLRMVKEPGEVELIRRAIRLNEEVLEELYALCDDQVTEADLAAEYEYRIRRKGASRAAFSPIIASGPNSAMPHATFTSQKLVPGAPLTFDIGCVVDGYCSDMTRTVFYKECPTRWEEIYRIVKEAKEAAMAYAKGGMVGKEVDRVARQIIEEAGYGDKFGHGLGHGLGIEVHEPPRYAKTGDLVVPAGAVMSIEPGIYLEGEGGIRIEDLVLVREDGVENLNSLTDELTIVGG